MRRIFSILTVFLVLNCCTFGWWRSPTQVIESEPIIIHDLVGDKIDLEERDRYGLFTNIDDFLSATFYDSPISEKGCKIVLITQDKRYVAWNNDPLTLYMLRDNIEHYDSISLSRSGFEEKWQIVDYDTLGLPITQAEIYHISKIPLNQKIAVSSIGIGCFSCLGCIIGGNLAPDDDDYNIWSSDTPKFEFPAEAVWGMFIGAAIGTVASRIYIKNIEQEKRAYVIYKIKEMRKPQEMK